MSTPPLPVPKIIDAENITPVLESAHIPAPFVLVGEGTVCRVDGTCD